MENYDFQRAKELAQEQEDWLSEQRNKKRDHLDLISQVKIFLYALTSPNFYNLSLEEEEFDFIADGLFDFVSTID